MMMQLLLYLQNPHDIYIWQCVKYTAPQLPSVFNYIMTGSSLFPQITTVAGRLAEDKVSEYLLIDRLVHFYFYLYYYM